MNYYPRCSCPRPYATLPPMCHCGQMPHYGSMPVYSNQTNQFQQFPPRQMRLNDQGPKPFVIDIEDAAENNTAFRTTLWTGKNLQVTLMSLNPGEDVGLETHPELDQFLRIEEGEGMVEMGPSKEALTFRSRVSEDDAIMVPADTWHNLTNTGTKALKLYSIYAPPEHPFGTVHQTKADDPGN